MRRNLKASLFCLIMCGHWLISGLFSGPSESPARKRRQREEDDGFKIIKNRHLKLKFEIGGGPGYLIHAGLSKGRAVIVKVFHAHAGPVSRQQLESTVALSRELLHPNVLRIEGVSSPKSLDHFIAYENVFWKNAECPLAVALKENLERSIVLGFKMVGGLASGMNYLAIQGISFAAMGVKNFDIFLDSDDRFLISINPCMAGATDSEAEEEEDDGSWRILNALCQKVLHSANRALHNEDIDREPVALDSFRTPRVSKPTPLLITSGPSGAAEPQQIEERPALPPRREYVWRTMARGQQCLATVARRIDSHLSLASLLHRMAYTDVKNPHRCPGYTREEITLTTNTVDSVVAEHDTPSPREICPICHDVVGLNELFSCPCGDPNPGTQFQANYVMDKSSLSAEECFVIYTVTVTLSIQPMAGAPTDDIYLFLFPANVDDSLDMHLPTECETYFWSFDPFGIERLSQDTLNELALPHIDFEGFVGAAQWSHEDYHLIGQVHCTRGFDPAGQDVAIALRYPLLDVDAVVMNDDEEDFNKRATAHAKMFDDFELREE
ncbi:hypothetical protein C8J57DRAFT_1509267 [Mycena rebaudengoi]|nr:hypothetical protein C8J57DRAFT_1509267 [Mycena rebaudengoi]